MPDESIEMSDETVESMPEESIMETESTEETVLESETHTSLSFQDNFDRFEVHFTNIENIMLLILLALGLIFGGVATLVFSHHFK